MKSWKLMLAAAFLAIFTSSVSSPVKDFEVGKKAPVMVFASDDASIVNARKEGKYLLLNLWSPSDAKSRIDAKRYENIAKEIDAENIVYLTVCTSNDKMLATQIAEVDNIENEHQLSATDELTGSLVKSVNGRNGLGTWLIAPDGTVIAANPDEKTLTNMQFS